MFCMEKIKAKDYLLNIVFWHVQFDGKPLFRPPHIYGAQDKISFQTSPFQGRLQFPRSQRLPFLPHLFTRPSTDCISRRFVEWRHDRLFCPPRRLWIAIKNSKNKTVFLTFLPPPDSLKQNKTSKQTERFNLDLWDLARGWQLELWFQRRLTKATAGARERLSQNLSVVVVRGCNRHHEPWKTVARLPNFLAFDSPWNSEYTYLSQYFCNQINNNSKLVVRT